MGGGYLKLVKERRNLGPITQVRAFGNESSRAVNRQFVER